MMNGRSIRLSCLVAIATSWALVACSVEPPADCSSQANPVTVVAEEGFADSIIRFVATGEGALDDSAIQVMRIHPGASCAEEHLDTYDQEGGAPRLEATFTHTVQGEQNLFAIVSWPLLHAGLDMDGRLYSVYAYHEVDGALVLNDVVTKDQQLYGGVEGTVEGEPSTFEGKDEQGVVDMLKRLGLE